MGGSLGILGLTARGFGAGEDYLSRDHKVDIVQFIALGWIHLACSFWREVGLHSIIKSSTA
jgi:hypothetical protein